MPTYIHTYTGNYNANATTLVDGMVVSTMMVLAFSIMTLYSIAMALSLLSWSNRQVAFGLVVRDTEDKTDNIKDRLTNLLAWVLSHPFSVCMHACMYVHMNG